MTHVVLRDRKPAAAAPVLDYPVCAILAKKEVGVLLVECVERCSLLSSQESSSSGTTNQNEFRDSTRSVKEMPTTSPVMNCLAACHR